jgi:light-harvesting complex I chlorophyll a/b binding protein 1
MHLFLAIMVSDRTVACALAFQSFPFPRRHGSVSSRARPSAFFTPVVAPSPYNNCRRCLTRTTLGFSSPDGKATDAEAPSQENDKEVKFLKEEIDHIETLQEIVDELEEFAVDEDFEDVMDNDDMIWSAEALSDIFGELPEDEDSEEEDEDFEEDENLEETLGVLTAKSAAEKNGDDRVNNDMDAANSAIDFQQMEERIRLSAAADLERALLQGVVPVSAGVGSECLAGDYGFDPFNLAEKDYFRPTQRFLLGLLAEGNNTVQDTIEEDMKARPKALVLRDYREAEIRHGRLAMLAATFWPLQEMLDRLLLDADQIGPLLYGPVTLPYFPLVMTAIMLLLGYLDIYAQAVKDMDEIGEAFLPGDCFWDPLRFLQGAPDSMKRNMQEREIFNGRVAMLAVAAFTWEEAITHLPLIEIGSNDILLEPLFGVPIIQEWLDAQFL